jgi:hypothetical protein
LLSGWPSFDDLDLAEVIDLELQVLPYSSSFRSPHLLPNILLELFFREGAPLAVVEEKTSTSPLR